jgi:hypothetical protein
MLDADAPAALIEKKAVGAGRMRSIVVWHFECSDVHSIEISRMHLLQIRSYPHPMPQQPISRLWA